MLTSTFRNSISVVFALAFSVSLGACTSRKNVESPNTVHLASNAKIKGLDPIFADDLYAGRQVAFAYEGLLQYHYLKRPYVLIPNLAESMPEISKDGKTYTFHIKKGVLFQDDASFKQTGGKGRELTAEDFVYSFKRLADPKLASGGWWIFDGKIAGLNEWHDAASKSGTAEYSKPVEGLKALDRYTLQIKLNHPSAQFLYALAMPFTFVVPSEAVEAYGKEFINHAVGTGPFRLQEFNGSSRVVWVRNPTFRKEVYPSEGEARDQAEGLLADAGKPLPLSDKVVYQIIEESQPLWLSFVAGKLDASGIPKDNFAQAIMGKDLSPDLKAKGIKLAVEPGLDVTHTSFNMADPLVGKNKLLRHAMSLAYDEDKWIELFWNGRGVSAQGPIPPGIEGYDPGFKNPLKPANIQKAKELLAKAGYPDGKGLPPLEFATLSDSTSRQSSEYMQKQFAQIGVVLKVNTYSWPEFQAAVKNKKGQIWSFAWSADYPDAENFLQLFYGKNASPGPNDSNYSNPEYDKLYEKSLVTMNAAERAALNKKMVDILIEDAPWIFGAHRLTYGLTQPWLRNHKSHDFDHGYVKYYRIDASAKK